MVPDEDTSSNIAEHITGVTMTPKYKEVVRGVYSIDTKRNLFRVVTAASGLTLLLGGSRFRPRPMHSTSLI